MDNEGNQIVTGNVVTNAAGVPMIAAKMGSTSFWIGITKEVSDEALIAMGAKADRLHVKQRSTTKNTDAARQAPHPGSFHRDG